MEDKHQSSWGRINTLHTVFFDICEDSYSKYLTLSQKINEVEEYSDEKDQLEKEMSMFGLNTIIYAGLCIESTIYNYAETHLGYEFVMEKVDSLSLLDKWLKVPVLICDKQIRKDRTAYEKLKKLIADRNNLVHHKSSELPENAEKVIQESETFMKNLEVSIHNAYATLFYLYLEMDRLVSHQNNPLLLYFNIEQSVYSTKKHPENLIPLHKELHRKFS